MADRGVPSRVCASVIRRLLQRSANSIFLSGRSTPSGRECDDMTAMRLALAFVRNRGRRLRPLTRHGLQTCSGRAHVQLSCAANHTEPIYSQQAKSQPS